MSWFLENRNCMHAIWQPAIRPGFFKGRWGISDKHQLSSFSSWRERVLNRRWIQCMEWLWPVAPWLLCFTYLLRTNLPTFLWGSRCDMRISISHSSEGNLWAENPGKEDSQRFTTHRPYLTGRDESSTDKSREGVSKARDEGRTDGSLPLTRAWVSSPPIHLLSHESSTGCFPPYLETSHLKTCGTWCSTGVSSLVVERKSDLGSARGQSIIWRVPIFPGHFWVKHEVVLYTHGR